ncbi:hypothetical protein [Brevibacillus sp. NRS-1366]
MQVPGSIQGLGAGALMPIAITIVADLHPSTAGFPGDCIVD